MPYARRRPRPVFFDRSGRRRRLVLLAGVSVATALVASLVVLVAGLSGAPPTQLPGFPDAGPHADRADTVVTPSPPARPDSSPSTATPATSAQSYKVQLSKVPVFIPVPNVNPLNRQLGAMPTLPTKYALLDHTAGLKPWVAALHGLAYASQYWDSVSASGTLDVVRCDRAAIHANQAVLAEPCRRAVVTRRAPAGLLELPLM